MIFYCGVCLNDRGNYTPLVGPLFSIKDPMHKTSIFHCMFCCEERHVHGTKTRVVLMPFKTETQETVYTLAHIVSGPKEKSA